MDDSKKRHVVLGFSEFSAAGAAMLDDVDGVDEASDGPGVLVE